MGCLVRPVACNKELGTLEVIGVVVDWGWEELGVVVGGEVYHL